MEQISEVEARFRARAEALRKRVKAANADRSRGTTLAERHGWAVEAATWEKAADTLRLMVVESTDPPRFIEVRCENCHRRLRMVARNGADILCVCEYPISGTDEQGRRRA
jgi:hypothetical protein